MDAPDKLRVVPTRRVSIREVVAKRLFGTLRVVMVEDAVLAKILV